MKCIIILTGYEEKSNRKGFLRELRKVKAGRSDAANMVSELLCRRF